MVKCDASYCKKQACFNYQKVWERFDVGANGNYGRQTAMHGLEEPIEEDNRHYCKKHAEQFENGEI